MPVMLMVRPFHQMLYGRVLGRDFQNDKRRGDENAHEHGYPRNRRSLLNMSISRRLLARHEQPSRFLRRFRSHAVRTITSIVRKPSTVERFDDDLSLFHSGSLHNTT
jgi:hypothetical protein